MIKISKIIRFGSKKEVAPAPAPRHCIAFFSRSFPPIICDALSCNLITDGSGLLCDRVKVTDPVSQETGSGSNASEKVESGSEIELFPFHIWFLDPDVQSIPGSEILNCGGERLVYSRSRGRWQYVPLLLATNFSDRKRKGKSDCTRWYVVLYDPVICVYFE